MMRNTLLIFIILLSFKSIGQSDSSIHGVIISIPDTSKHIRIEIRTSHRYNSQNYNYTDRNIKLKTDGKNYIIETFDDSNRILKSYLVCTKLYIDYISLNENDSIPVNNVNHSVLGNDSTLPNLIVIYYLGLIECGYYNEFHLNGKIKIKGKYNKNGFKKGTWRYYNENGEFIRKERYKKGRFK